MIKFTNRHAATVVQQMDDSRSVIKFRFIKHKCSAVDELANYDIAHAKQKAR